MELHKLEVYKILGEMGGFIDTNLFDRSKDFKDKKRLKDIYQDLSLFVHPSIKECKIWIETPFLKGTIGNFY